MLIKNISGTQFSLEGVIIESGQTKELPNEQAQRFLDIYAHVEKLKRATPIDSVNLDEVVSQPKEVVPVEEKVEEPVVEQSVGQQIIDSEVKVPDEVPPPLKVFKRKSKTQ